MKVAILQLNTTVGAIEANAAAVKNAAEHARRMGATLALFPELSLTGLPLLHLAARKSLQAQALQAETELIADLPEGLTVVFGNLSADDPVDHAAVVAKRGQKLHTIRRAIAMDESAPAEILDIEGHRVAILFASEVCPRGRYDWGSADPFLERNAKAGAEVQLILSAQTWAYQNRKPCEQHLSAMAKKVGNWLLLAKHVGANGSHLYNGNSLAISPEGHIALRAHGWKSDLRVINLEQPVKQLEPAQESIQDLAQGLTIGIRDYFSKSGMKRAVIGLSGGIDSAVTAYLAAEALIPAQITGVAMPSRYSSKHSVEDAKALAQNLGIRFEMIPIEFMFESTLASLAAVFDGLPAGLAEENIQARLRGIILMGIANKFDGLVLATGNKSEAAMGYATLYGDTVGALSVLQDLYKYQVYELARYANRDGERIPQSSIDKPPSAELRPGQLDTDSLPPYPVLDPIIERFLEEGGSIAEIAEATGADEATVRLVVSRIDQYEFKRRQTAPLLQVSKTSWNNRRFPVVSRFRED